jgi:hypothetical protein
VVDTFTTSRQVDSRMIIPFDLLRITTSTDGRRCTINTPHVDMIQILYCKEEAISDLELRGTLDIIAEAGGYFGEGVDEFITEILQDLQQWKYVEEVESDDESYWVLTPKGVLLKEEIAGL